MSQKYNNGDMVSFEGINLYVIGMHKVAELLNVYHLSKSKDGDLFRLIQEDKLI